MLGYSFRLYNSWPKSQNFIVIDIVFDYLAPKPSSTTLVYDLAHNDRDTHSTFEHIFIRQGYLHLTARLKAVVFDRRYAFKTSLALQKVSFILSTASMVVLCISTYYFVLILIPLLLCMALVLYFYLKTSVEVRRVEAIC